MRAVNFKIHGIDFDLLDPDDSTLRESVPGNDYEPAVTRLIMQIFSQSRRGTFLDIGALYGFFSCYVGSISPHIEVIAFEPGTRAAEYARRNAIRNSLRNIRVEQIALSHESGIRVLRGKSLVRGSALVKTPRILPSDPVSPTDSGTEITRRASSSLLAWLASSMIHALRILRGWEFAEVVRCSPFDGKYDQTRAKPVVIKIDVHGAEVNVLRGMRQYLRDHADVLFLEMHRDNMLVEGTHADTVGALRESGLELSEIVHFRKDSGWRVQPLSDKDLESLKSSASWSARDRVMMKMLMGVRRGSGYERLYS